MKKRFRRALIVVSALVFVVFAPVPGAMAAAQRVVSMNLCTDQLLMLVADKTQIASLSHLARDETLAVMSAEARNYPVNHGRAEEIYLSRPDLVLAGSYTQFNSINMLRGLGISVEQFAPVRSLKDIPANLRRVGALVGREARAEALVAAFQSQLAEAQRTERAENVPAAIYYANSYTAGQGTLMDEVVGAARLENIADRLSLTGTRSLPLELLVMESPDVLVTARKTGHPPALAHEILRHPALRRTIHRQGEVAIHTKYTICGLPFITRAIEMLTKAGDVVTSQAESRK